MSRSTLAPHPLVSDSCPAKITIVRWIENGFTERRTVAFYARSGTMPYRRRIVGIAAAIGAVLLLGIFLSAGIVLFQNQGSHTGARQISFSQLLNDVEAGRVHDVLIRGSEIYGTFNDGHRFQTYAPADPLFVQRLRNKGVSITTQP